METERYEIVGHEAHWHVEYNGEPGMGYATKEAAFEAAFSGATNAVKAGHDVTIHVAGVNAGETALGTSSGFELRAENEIMKRASSLACRRGSLEFRWRSSKRVQSV